MIGRRYSAQKEKSQEAEKGTPNPRKWPSKVQGAGKGSPQINGLQTKRPSFETANMNPGLIQPYES